MVMPRSRSMSMESRIWSRASRAETALVAWRRRSASVDLPWSMCAMIEKFRIWGVGWGIRRIVFALCGCARGGGAIIGRGACWDAPVAPASVGGTGGSGVAGVHRGRERADLSRYIRVAEKRLEALDRRAVWPRLGRGRPRIGGVRGRAETLTAGDLSGG